MQKDRGALYRRTAATPRFTAHHTIAKIYELSPFSPPEATMTARVEADERIDSHLFMIRYGRLRQTGSRSEFARHRRQQEDGRPFTPREDDIMYTKAADFSDTAARAVTCTKKMSRFVRRAPKMYRRAPRGH